MNLPYNVKYTSRKTICIRVKFNGSIEVRAPIGTPASRIDKFYKEKENWIIETQTKQKKNFQEIGKLYKTNNIFEYGSKITLLGKEFPIIGTSHNSDDYGYDGTKFYMPENLTTDKIKFIIFDIYKNIAIKYINKRVNYIKSLMNLEPTAVKINDAKTRWGSCSRKKVVNFSWLLIIAEDEVVDYVIVHELSHFFEMNHSDRFWNIVGQVIPNYKEYRKKLLNLQTKLTLEGWYDL
ncbi:MAG: M48 family metallopeptidase [Christensenellaceae bacterium]|jgi:predicted metal-dependent hydrolase|nr:M48 family metallopeptidase [Christensenellaceae bacterium]